jgi:hypothetical protein
VTRATAPGLRHGQRAHAVHALHHGLAFVLALIAVAGCPLYAKAAAPLRHEPPPFAFAVLSGVMRDNADEPDARRLIDAIGLDRSVAFTVYDGDIKGPDELCTDELYRRRGDLLAAARTALVFVPGENDWVRCNSEKAGNFDPVERLDFLRQELLPDTNSLGQAPLALTRESEVPRFRTFRENARWTSADIAFITINAPNPNNRYLTAGGRNGEFDDRALANTFWIEHAVEYAKRHDARAVVVFMEGDPQFTRDLHDRFAWLHFERSRERDGFREVRRALAKAASGFNGVIVVVHASQTALPYGFHIDRPLRDADGKLVPNVTRIAIAPPERLTQWVRIEIDPNRRPMFRVNLAGVPKHLPKPAAPVAASDASQPQLPDMPQIETQPILPDPPASSASTLSYGVRVPAAAGLLEPVAPASNAAGNLPADPASVQNAR